MNPLRLFVCELHPFSCLSNQRPYIVPVVTRTKQYIDSEFLAYGLSCGRYHFVTDFWKECETDLQRSRHKILDPFFNTFMLFFNLVREHGEVMMEVYLLYSL